MIADIEDQDFISLWYEFVNRFIDESEAGFLCALEGVCCGWIRKTQSEFGYVLSLYDIGDNLWFRRIESCLEPEVNDFIVKFESHMESKAKIVYRLTNKTSSFYFCKTLSQVTTLIQVHQVMNG